MSSPSKNSDLPLRLVSALILGTMVLAITWYGGVLFRLLAGVTALLIFREWVTITGVRRHAAIHVISWLFVTLCVVAAIVQRSDEALIICVVAAVVLAVWGWVVNRTVWAAGGVVYSLVPMIALIHIRESPQGLMLLILIFVIVWGTDTGAYFTGRALGGPKLAPSISPKKTWSGFFGGLIVAIIGSLIYMEYSDSLSLYMPILLVGFVSIISQIGDLYESWIKRRFDVKDSGQLIPGHGGIMDRVDGLIVAAVAFYGFMIVGLA